MVDRNASILLAAFPRLSAWTCARGPMFLAALQGPRPEAGQRQNLPIEPAKKCFRLLRRHVALGRSRGSDELGGSLAEQVRRDSLAQRYRAFRSGSAAGGELL